MSLSIWAPFDFLGGLRLAPLAWPSRPKPSKKKRARFEASKLMLYYAAKPRIFQGGLSLKPKPILRIGVDKLLSCLEIFKNPMSLSIGRAAG
jgi:hypothetical protein